jgi:4'-phosphopantetheinyl transferase
VSGLFLSFPHGLRQNTDALKLQFHRLQMTAPAAAWRWEWVSDIPDLTPGEVHVWLADLDLGLESTLDAAEDDRAQRFRFETDRRRFIHRRSILRLLAGGYLQQPPAEVKFTTDEFGKLHVAGGLEFNLSAAGDLVVYGFVREHRLGIDLARLSPDFRWQEVVESFFHSAESAYIHQLPSSEQTAAFFRLWTIKEAFVKANGGGLSQPLMKEDFTALARDGQRTRTLSDGTQWRWVGWEPMPGTLASLVTEA